MYNFKLDSFNNCKQVFYVINKERFNYLKQLSHFEEVTINKTLIDKLNMLLQFVNSHEGFCCAITKAQLGKKRYFWFPMLFYKKFNRWIRVRIETVKCSACGWQGNIANPTLPDLYETLDNKYKLMKAGEQIETIPCPICNCLLERHAIWVETVSQNETTV